MRYVLLGVMLLSILMFTSCGDAPAPDEEGAPPAAPSTTEAPEPAAQPPAEPPAAQTSQAIGDAVGALYIDTMKQVTAALEGSPDVEVAKAELTKIKADAVGKLVELGRKRAALDGAGKAAVDRGVRGAMRRVPPEVFEAFSAAHKHYAAADRETGDLLASFNVITQYAAFELLKKQAPEEFERLGLSD